MHQGLVLAFTLLDLLLHKGQSFCKKLVLPKENKEHKSWESERESPALSDSNVQARLPRPVVPVRPPRLRSPLSPGKGTTSEEDCEDHTAKGQ